MTNLPENLRTCPRSLIRLVGCGKDIIALRHLDRNQWIANATGSTLLLARQRSRQYRGGRYTEKSYFQTTSLITSAVIAVLAETVQGIGGKKRTLSHHTHLATQIAVSTAAYDLGRAGNIRQSCITRKQTYTIAMLVQHHEESPQLWDPLTS
ncbi:hypothetical protein Tco_1202615 [Tanacetum coccineum]